jgi:hypothetical protein
MFCLFCGQDDIDKSQTTDIIYTPIINTNQIKIIQ